MTTSEEGAKAEREAIVAWLREHSWECQKQVGRCKADKAFPFASEFGALAVNYSALAAAIERGDHLMKGKSDG